MSMFNSSAAQGGPRSPFSSLSKNIGERTGDLLGRMTSLSKGLRQLSRPLAARLPGMPQRVLPPDNQRLADDPNSPSLPFHLVPGARIGKGKLSLSFAGGDLRILQHEGRRVVGWTSIPLSPSAVRSGAVVDAAELAASLDDIFLRLKLPKKGLIGGFSGLRASSALLELPWVRESDLQEVVSDEAQRVLAASNETHFLFWQRLSGRRRERYIYLLAVPREPLLITLDAFESAHLSLTELEIRPISLARAVNQRDAIIAYLEPDGLDVVIVVDDLPVLFRSLALSSETGTREYAAESLVTEVRRALAAYEDALPGQLLDPNAPIILSGSLGQGIALAEKLRALTGHPIGTAAPALHLPSDFPLSEQLVNVGLALKRF